MLILLLICAIKHHRTLGTEEVKAAQTTKPELGQYLRQCRKQARLTLEAVSSFVGLSLGYLSRIELGQVIGGPSTEALEKLTTAVNADWNTVRDLAGIEIVDYSSDEATLKVVKERSCSADLLQALSTTPNPTLSLAILLAQIEDSLGFPLSRESFEAILRDHARHRMVGQELPFKQAA